MVAPDTELPITCLVCLHPISTHNAVGCMQRESDQHPCCACAQTVAKIARQYADGRVGIAVAQERNAAKSSADIERILANPPQFIDEAAARVFAKVVGDTIMEGMADLIAEHVKKTIIDPKIEELLNAMKSGTFVDGGKVGVAPTPAGETK